MTIYKRVRMVVLCKVKCCLPWSMLEPTQSSRQNLVLEFPRSTTVAGTEVPENLEPKEYNAEMNFSGQRMTLGLGQTNYGTANQATEQLLVLQVAQADSIEMALKKLKNSQVWREGILSL